MGLPINYATVCVPTTSLEGVPGITLEKMMGSSNAGGGEPFDCDPAKKQFTKNRQQQVSPGGGLTDVDVASKLKARKANAGGGESFDCGAARERLKEIEQQLEQLNKTASELKMQVEALKAEINKKCGKEHPELIHNPPRSR